MSDEQATDNTDKSDHLRVISTRRPSARSRGGQRCGQWDPWRKL